MNVRYKRDFSVLFFAVGALVLLPPGWRAQERERERKSPLHVLQGFVPSAYLSLCGVIAYKIATSCEHKPSDHSVQSGNVFVLDVLIACVYL